MPRPEKKPSCQVYVSQIPLEVSAQELACFLQEEIGEVLRVKLKGYQFKGKWHSKGHAYVDFLTESVAKHACDKADYDDKGPLLLKGSKLKISMVKALPSSTNVLEEISVECGVLSGWDSLSRMWKSDKDSVRAQFDFEEKKFRLYFTKVNRNSRLWRETVYSIPERASDEYKLEFRLRDIRACWMDPALGPGLSIRLFVELSTSPHIFIRSADDQIWTDVMYVWTRDDDDPWTRTTDWTKKEKMGICNYYCLSIPMRYRRQIESLIGRRFNQHNWRPKLHLEIHERKLPDWVEPKAWFLTFSETAFRFKVPINVLFLLNSLVLKGIVPFTNISEDLLNLLARSNKHTVEMALRRMFTYYFPVFEPARRLRFEMNRLLQLKATTESKSKILELPENHVRIKRVIITPTTAHALPPEIELSNRVVRHYKSEVDHFLRVTFMDEGMEQLSSWALVDNTPGGGRDKRNLIYDRIMSIVKYGFVLCGERFAFLGCSNSQSREKSAWFFAEGTTNITVQSIRKWMGDFTEIKNVAKCQARMGQCFSSTFYRINVPRSERLDVEDIKNEKYTFSDGVGKIVPKFADELAKGLAPFLGNSRGVYRTPSAFQIRYAGYKGVLAVWPPLEDSPYKIFCRPSMEKFKSDHCDLEIVGWSSFQPGFLNRQIITLLSTLSAKDEAFMDRQDKMIKRLDSVLANREDALSVLENSCTGDLHSTAMTMLRGGFHPKKEPHLLNMLRAIRALQLHELIFKARIFIPKSRWMMGVIDETATLQYGECFVQVSGPDDNGEWQEGNHSRVITGPICFGKNPCHHPGDLRILQAVDKPQLHHLVDCIVLPVTGPRSHADEASGSDFDGDVYYVLWDEDLLPPNKKSAEPMDYVSSQQRTKSHDITPEDLQEFFVRQMMNDSVGVICNAHLVHADRSEKGAYDPACLELAKQAALAFDFPKTGIPGVMPQNLRVEEYPDFMEKEDKKGKYISKKVLGKLYRVVKGKIKSEQEKNSVVVPVIGSSVEEEPLSWFPTIEEIGKTFDKDLLVSGYEDHLETAMEVKRKYDENVHFLMNQYGITTEGELVTGHVIHLSRYFRKQERGAKEKIVFLFSALRREFRNIFLSHCGVLKVDPKVDNDASVEEDSPIYEFKDLKEHAPVKTTPTLPILKPTPLMKVIVSAWYFVTYNPEWLKKQENDDDDERLLISFCWLVADVLCDIKSSKI